MKVILREWNKKDTVLLTELANNKLIADNLRDHFPNPYTLKDAEEWISLNQDRMPVINFAIEAGGQLAGGCGIFFKEDIYRCSAEIGYWLG